MAVLAHRVGGWEGEVIHHMNYKCPPSHPGYLPLHVFYVNVLHGKIFAFMLMYLLCEDLHTGAPPFIKKGLFKALGFSTGKEGLKQ